MIGAVAEIDAGDIRSIMESLMVLHGKTDRILELLEDDEEEEEETDD